MAREITSRRSAVRPVAKVMVCVGSGPSVLLIAFQKSQTSGARHASHVSVLSAISDLRFIASLERSRPSVARKANNADSASVILFQVHAGIHRSHLITVAIEHQRGALLRVE